MSTKKIMISTGEASGDLHCSATIRHLQSTSKLSFELFGMGGKHLAECDMELLIDIEASSVMGFVEVIKQYPQLRAQLKLMRNALKERRPDLLLLVDYPGFNLRLADTARELGIPVLYFIAPKIWASRPKRIEQLKQTVDMMAVILPFEKGIYENANIPVIYVGNPVLDNPNLASAIAGRARTRPSSELSDPKVALLPGSRKSEIDQLLPEMLESAAHVLASHPQATFCLPIADTVDRNHINQYLDRQSVPVKLLHSEDYRQIAECDAAIVASGTATLELALLSVPMVVVYRLHYLSYKVAKSMLLIDKVSLVNIVAQQTVAVELIQDDMNAENISTELKNLLFNDSYRDNRLSQLLTIRERLGEHGAAEPLAAAIQQLTE